VRPVRAADHSPPSSAAVMEELNLYLPSGPVTGSLYIIILPVPLAARSKAYVFGRSPAEIVSSNPTGGIDVCLL